MTRKEAALSAFPGRRSCRAGLLERLASGWRGWRERMAGIFARTLFYVLGMSAARLAAWIREAARAALAI